MNKPEDIITFGKYKGKTFYEISYIDPDYIVWLNENVKTIKLPEKFVDEVEMYIREENSQMHDIISEYRYQ